MIKIAIMVLATLNLSITMERNKNENLFNSRQFHKALAPWIFLPLFISSITGLLYRVSKDLLGYSREQVHWLMSLHEGEWIVDY